MSALRNTLGTALGITARSLSVASKLMDVTAKTLRPGTGGTGGTDDTETPAQRAPVEAAPPPPSPPIGTEAAVEDVAEAAPGPVRVVEPPPTPLLDETPHVRTSESHIEELAAKPAGQVAAAVANLSTDELRLLTEYEMAHKNRRTVLAAIERALAPAPSSADDEIVLPEAGGVPTSGTLDGAS